MSERCTGEELETFDVTPVQGTTLPALVVHADWGSSPKKRWMARATLREDGRYLAHHPESVGELDDLLQRLSTAAGPDGSAFVGFDFPIGLPIRYADGIEITDFLTTLTQLGRDPWAEFYDVAERPDEISLRRPFYPKRPGGTKQRHLLDGLGIASIDHVRGHCEGARADRRAAAPLFWALGGQQVGKAAIIGWRDVLAPGLRDDSLRLAIWPFSGKLFELFRPGYTVVAETYPTEVCTHFCIEFSRARGGSKSGKRVQGDRAASAHVLEGWADASRVSLCPAMRQAIRDGFGPTAAGEDQFDAAIGLFGRLEVVLGQRAPGEPQDDAIRRVEGWILGQLDECSPLLR